MCRATRALVAVAVLTSAGCAASAEVAVANRPSAVVERAETAIAVPTTAPTARPTPTASPTPSAIPAPTPTPLPTPTPTPSPATDTTPECVLSGPGDSFAGVEVTIAVLADTGEWVYRQAAELALLPASNQKILTAMGALQILDEDFRFVTEVRLDPASTALHLVGGGDPTLTRRHLDALAERVRDSVTSVGDVVVDASRYADVRTAPGWQDWQIPTHVGPLSTLIVDGNRWRTDDEFLARPDLANAALFAERLEAAGVRVEGGVRTGAAPVRSHAVAEIRSRGRDALVTQMMLTSDNEIAESLVREIGALAGNLGDTAAGLEAIIDRLTALGLPMAGDDGDGSGLSRANHRSAETWAALLHGARSMPWFDTFASSLPVSGRSGTLTSRLGSPTTVGRVRAKTGTIIGGRALGGYLTTEGGQDLAFSIVVNGDGAHTSLPALDDFVTAAASLTNGELAECIAGTRGSRNGP